MESNFYIESIEPLVPNNFYDLVQLDFICMLYQVEKDTQSNICFFECRGKEKAEIGMNPTDQH